MNRRALGCGIAGAAVFVAVGLVGLLMVIPQAGCPARLLYGALGYLPDRNPTDRPQVSTRASDPEPVQIGTTFIGLTTRAVYAMPRDVPPSGSGQLPAQLALDCGDGTYQAYRSESMRRSPDSAPPSP